jgi:hypothetical protein
MGEKAMETVKVDIQKLQLLNDRINQAIDALTQVRQSVHGYQPTMGLQHSMGGFVPQQTLGFGYGMPMQQSQQFGQLYGQQFGQPYGLQFGQPYGLQHTAAPFIGQQTAPLAYNVPSWPAAVTPWTSGVGQMGWYGAQGGLSHSGVAPIDAPALRITQTFPFAFSPVPAVL